jgi:hypothetical protein
MNDKRTWLDIMPTLTDAELRREYSNLFDEGQSYRAAPAYREIVLAKLTILNNEMRKRGI